MFWGLNGATESPRRRTARQSPATTVDLPASGAGALNHHGAVSHASSGKEMCGEARTDEACHGAPSRREPSGRPLPVAASYPCAGNNIRKLGSTARIDAAQDVWREISIDSRLRFANRWGCRDGRPAFSNAGCRRTCPRGAVSGREPAVGLPAGVSDREYTLGMRWQDSIGVRAIIAMHGSGPGVNGMIRGRRTLAVPGVNIRANRDLRVRQIE